MNDDAEDLLDRAQDAPTDNAVVEELNVRVIAEFRANGGQVSGWLADSDLLLLHHRGARSGVERVSPLGYLRHEGALLVVASLGGAPVNPAWFHNIQANPDVTIEIGGETAAMTASVVSADERAVLWPLITARYPGQAEYQTKTTRILPVVRLTNR
ncbi:nitroreductase family deazaflavin-dependent oxidoreductase [Actinoplanes sp. NPDC049265]|uniref:nitroreductase family deazaflavin-dependent oxidoreductase n=1 Tax=Actinoplanes sp. NPDC049265 TaxID=3363902 RepID=UPI00371C8CDB